MGIYLDGDGDYVDLDNAPIMADVDDLCLEGWFYYDVSIVYTGVRNILIYNGSGASNGYGLEAGPSAARPTKLGLLLGGVVHIDTGIIISRRLWRHYAATRRSGTWYFYDMGVESGVTVGTAPNMPTNYTTIGWDHGNNEFTGYVCECRVWSVGRTEKQIRGNMRRRLAAQPGLEAYIRFLEQTGGTAVDMSGNGNHGTLVGNPTWDEGYPIPHGRPYILP